MNENTNQTAPKTFDIIDGNTLRVKIHFSATSKETMSDKIKRLLRNEVGRM
jgi:hypothetical protein